MSPNTAGRSADKSSADKSAGVAREHLLALLGPVVAASGYDLDDVTVTSAGRRSLVRVSVDADGGIDLDAVATVGRVVSDALDADTEGDRAFVGPYVLEVSSPGVDRPLTEPRHWRRAKGRLVEVTVGGKAVLGRVTGTSADGVTLDIKGITRQLIWSDLGRGRVQVEFNARTGRGETSEAAEED